MPSVTHSRKTDPQTSLDAGDRHERSGHAEAHRQRCEMAVFQNPGMTARTIAKIADVERHEASRRLPELRTDGQVRHCRKCSERWNVCEPKACTEGPEIVNSEMIWYHKTYEPPLEAGEQGELFQ
ncbi:MAG: hypothetical protein ABIG61_12215 [Planctomycetota bacterium]